MFSSSTLIRLDKDAFEGHMCQTVNNFVKQDKSSLLSPLRKRRPPQLIKHVRNTRVSRIPTLDEPCSSTLHPLNFLTVVFLVILVRDLSVTFDQFLNFDDIITAIYISTYFILGTLEKFGIYHRIMLVILLFMHLLVVDCGVV